MTSKRITSAEMDKKTKACFGPDGFWYVSPLQGMKGHWHGAAYVPGGKKQPENSKLSTLRVWGKTELEAKRKLFVALTSLENLVDTELVFVEEDETDKKEFFSCMIRAPK